MEHVAKHLDAAAGGEAEERIVFGGEGDETLMEYVTRQEVGVVVADGKGGWVRGFVLGKNGKEAGGGGKGGRGRGGRRKGKGKGKGLGMEEEDADGEGEIEL